MVRFTTKDLERLNRDNEGNLITNTPIKKKVKLKEDDITIPSDSIYIPFNVPSSKNNKQIRYIFGKIKNPNIISKMRVRGIMKDCVPTISESELCDKYRLNTEMYWKLQRAKFIDLSKQFIGQPFIIEFTFIRGNSNRFDFHNLVQLPMDLMVEHGWIPDDDMKNVLPVPPLPPDKSFYYNKQKAGLIIKIKNNDYRSKNTTMHLGIH